ncbi:hypothetical protein SH501x_002296 [Pirellulaceae bacterium SH501]
MATIASVNELEAKHETTFVFNDPIISIAKSIDPLNYGLRAYPSLEILSTNVNLKQIEPRTVSASKHSSWVNELHGFSGRTPVVTDVAGDHVSKSQESTGGDFGAPHCSCCFVSWFTTQSVFGS